MASGVSIVSGKLPARNACAESSSRSATASRCRRKNSSTVSRSASTVVSVRVSVSAMIGPGLLVGVHVGRRAVGEAAIRPQHALQPVAALAAEDLHRQVQRQVVGVIARGSPSWPTRISVCTAPGRSTTTTRRVGVGRIGLRSTAGTVAARPVAERLLHRRRGGVGADVADDGDQRVVRREPLLVERDEVVARQRGQRLRRAVATAGRRDGSRRSAARRRRWRRSRGPR